MATSAESLSKRLDRIKADLVDQGRRVQALLEAALDAVFSRDPEAALRVVALDEAIDRVDVEIEKASVQLLTDACGLGASLAPDELRMVLTIVKVNNELERIADAGVSIAEEARLFSEVGTPLPPTFRVLSNSVVGMIRDATTALQRLDGELARVVLLSEEAVGEFKKSLVRDSQEQLARGRMSVDLAMGLGEVATRCVVMSDHCTNIAEQVIYVATGTIVRHMKGRWEEVRLPS